MGLSLLLGSALPLDVLLTVLTGGGLDNPRRFLTGLLWGLFGTSAALRLLALLGRRRDPSARAGGGRPLPA